LALEDLVAFVDPHFGQAPWDLGGDLHFGGFQAAIAHAQTFGQTVLGGAPVTEAAGTEQQRDQENGKQVGRAGCGRHGCILRL